MPRKAHALTSSCNVNAGFDNAEPARPGRPAGRVRHPQVALDKRTGIDVSFRRRVTMLFAVLRYPPVQAFHGPAQCSETARSRSADAAASSLDTLGRSSFLFCPEEPTLRTHVGPTAIAGKLVGRARLHTHRATCAQRRRLLNIATSPPAAQRLSLACPARTPVPSHVLRRASRAVAADRARREQLRLRRKDGHPDPSFDRLKIEVVDQSTDGAARSDDRPSPPTRHATPKAVNWRRDQLRLRPAAMGEEVR